MVYLIFYRGSNNLPPMNIEEKRKIAFEMWNWGAQAVKFVRDFLQEDLCKFGNASADEPRLRLHYILLSYGFEMILKSRIVMLSDVQNEDQLNERLQKIGHDFVKIANTLGNDLKNIGIIKIEPKKERKYKYFIVKMINGKQIRVENFTDIRYGRMNYFAEHKEVVEYTENILKIWEKIKKANDST